MSRDHLPTVSLYFRFYGESFDPAEITSRLGITPSLQFRPGDPITKEGRGRRRASGWMVKVGPRNTLEIDELMRELRETITVSSTVVREVCEDLKLDLVILCGVGMGDSEDFPITFFPQGFVEWAAVMGAAINIDIVA